MSHENDRIHNVVNFPGSRKSTRDTRTPVGVADTEPPPCPDCPKTYFTDPRYAPGVEVCAHTPDDSCDLCNGRVTSDPTRDPALADFRARFEGCRIALEHAIQVRDTSEIAASYASLLTLCDDVIEALEVAHEDRDTAIDELNQERGDAEQERAADAYEVNP